MVRAPGRRLSPEEAALWARLVQTVRPLEPKRAPPPIPPGSVTPEPPARKAKDAPAPAHLPPKPSPAPRPLDRHGLDGTWERRLAKGEVSPDFTLDLHGASLEAAHARLEHGLALAVAQGARLVLLITGRPRGEVAPADRGSRRGAIRAKLFDWLALGSHGSRIAAVRAAHPRHGGAGAVYIVLRRAK